MLTPSARDLILESLRVGCSLADSARGAKVTEAACLALAREDSEEGRAWAAAVSAALAEGERARAEAPAPTWQDVAKASEPVTYAPPAPGAAIAPTKSKRASEASDDGTPDWYAFREAAAGKYGKGRTGLYLLQDERLVTAGLPATSPWWRWTFTNFFESELTWLLAMVGRGAGKSTFLERLLLIVILFTERTVPPGQTYFSPFISVLPEDALRRIYEIKTLLLFAYRLEVKIKEKAISLKDICDNDIDLISVAGTVGRVSGPSTVSVIFDEAAKLHTAAGAANNDSELIASIVGTSRLLPGWAGVRCSSAYETRGAHFLSCMEGTNQQNFVATIGAQFITEALAGLEEVARFEAAQGNTHDAARIRAFAKTLHPESPNVPTWVARPEQTAIRLRMMLDTLPKDDAALEGLTRSEFFLREYASMPLSREGRFSGTEQCIMAGKMMGLLRGNVGRGAPGGVMKVAGARLGDARYAGPAPRGAGQSTGWKGRRGL